ncbi:hypothetical protein I6I68_10800 [Corynebacterium glucuronolyticum]|nr:hypothetical protein I6I68_10800 [Corynebacterium glucuronolyticum]
MGLAFVRPTFSFFAWHAERNGCTLVDMTDKHNLNPDNIDGGSHTFSADDTTRVNPEFHTEQTPERVEKVIPAQETHVERVTEQPVVETHRERPQRVVEDAEKKGSALPWVIGVIVLLLLAALLWWLLGGQKDDGEVAPATTTVDVTTEVTETVSPEATTVDATTMVTETAVETPAP